MKDSQRILISSIAFQSNKIGSWTTRMNTFLDRNPNFFDVILSPTNSVGKFQHCKKAKFPTYHSKLRNTVLLKVVAKDYLKALERISKESNKMTLVVMDDPHLLEAVVKSKQQWNCEIEIIYSFHGFKSTLDHLLLQGVNKMLFLTQSGYLATKNTKFSFTPEVFIIGNGVDSKVFFPLDAVEKEKRRTELGISPNEKVILWMANERPIKGFQLFLKIASRLKTKHKNLKFLAIGTDRVGIEEEIEYLGRIPNNELPHYLQAGDVYLFTSLCREGFGLSGIEALKCGNTVIASDNGGIAEVLENLPNTHLIHSPNITDEWVKTIERLLVMQPNPISNDQSSSIWNYEDWESRFIHSIQS
ncbi:MAG: glycosyltransferase family 4 protein [Flavobacteriaceae bacterium]|nr:glycosyltransferase family 4 protein [Flavobacteriaceae bacterium]